jgi:hypothetical protein
MVVAHVAVRQQDLDQCRGAGSVAVGCTGGGPPGVVDTGELPRGAGLLQRGRAPGQWRGQVDAEPAVPDQVQRVRPGYPWLGQLELGPLGRLEVVPP